MKVAVVNFSGNTGKSTISKHLLLPRIKDAELITVEPINADEGDGEKVRGKQFGALMEQLMLIDAAVVDVGSSNVEDFMKLMMQYRGSHEDIDFFVVPAVKDSKQIKDTNRYDSGAWSDEGAPEENPRGGSTVLKPMKRSRTRFYIRSWRSTRTPRRSRCAGRRSFIIRSCINACARSARPITRPPR